MRASSALIFEYGTNISVFCARVPLRTRAKKSGRNAAEITNARERCLDEALEKFIHTLTTQCDFRSNCLLLSQFEIGNAFLGQRFNRPLARDQGQFRLGFLQRLFHVRLRADASVDQDLLHLRNLVKVFIAVLFLQRRHYPLYVIAIKFVFHFQIVILVERRISQSTFRVTCALPRSGRDDRVFSLSIRRLSPASRPARSISRWKYESDLRVPRSCHSGCPAISEGVS